MLSPGEKMPKFALPDQNGEIIKSSRFQGKPLIVYFYRRDYTPGCTIGACSFRDRHSIFEKRGVSIVGISTDPIAIHKRFADNNNLSFTLLSDPEKKVMKAFGAWGEKKTFGVTREGIIRSTFVIDADGKIKKVFRRVKPSEHAEKVLAALDE